MLLLSTGAFGISLRTNATKTVLGGNQYLPTEVPLRDKLIALVTSFAAQAGIAIENAAALTNCGESRQQQTATSYVLR